MVYRATRDGFDAAAFHKLCDGRRRLLVVVREKETGWLFGGYTKVGFIRGADRAYADPAAFLFTLTNPSGRPEHLTTRGFGNEVLYNSTYAAAFGLNRGTLAFCIVSGADKCRGNLFRSSHTHVGFEHCAFYGPYAQSAEKGPHPMGEGYRDWSASEIVAWKLPDD